MATSERGFSLQRVLGKVQNGTLWSYQDIQLTVAILQKWRITVSFQAFITAKSTFGSCLMQHWFNGECNLQSYDYLIISAFKCDFVQHSSLNRGVKTCLPHPVATVVNENIRTTTTYFLCCNNIRIQAINIGVRMMTKGMLIQCIV